MKKIKLLYLSCHSIAEYDEIKLFKEMGIDVYSHGAYSNPNKPGDRKRPAISGKYDDHWVQLCMKHGKENLPPEMIEPFDIIFCHYYPDYILNNWEKMKHKIVIWRTNGQSTQDVENRMGLCREEGMKIVRYADIERTIPDYIGHDAIIRFYKNPKEFTNWNGDKRVVINATQNLKKRGKFCNYDMFEKATSPFARRVFGPDNENLGYLWGGLLSYKDLKQQFRDNRVYFYTGTTPACYTLNFIEAWMTGIPIVAIGGEYGNANYLPNQYTYEIPFIMENKKEGFFSDDIGELQSYIQDLLNNYKLAQFVSKAGRKKAIKLFGKETIKKQWLQFFNGLL